MSLGRLDSNRQGQPMAEINIIPLVDVMLVLLVIFIVTAPMLTHAVKLDLPQASSHPNALQAENIEISVQQDGRIYWDGEPVSPVELEQRAAKLVIVKPAAEIHLKGDAQVPYGEMAHILSILARQGLMHIGFVTDPGIGSVTNTRY